ncbi:MAG: Rne/Rng family ribonuclease [Myxococcales bacterium]
MGSVLLINCSREENRVVLQEHGITAEVYIERSRGRGLVGNIYKGRVVRVLPGMQSAFVEIGLDRTAFLYVSDVARPDHGDNGGLDDGEGAGEPEGEGGEDGSPATPAPEMPTIDQLLREGQSILVQIAKEPIGTKGARLTTHISLPGRHVVLLPTVEHVGVSRRIEDAAERERLRELAAQVKAPAHGLIVRTVAEGREAEELREDAQMLQALWEDIRGAADTATAPALVHEDLDLVLRCVRDMLTSDFERVVVDDERQHARICAFVERFMPRFLHLIELYQDEEPLFERFGVEVDITRALERKVWLKSGGYIVIDRSEALTAIDVNTGRYVGKTNLEDTIVKINLEAVKEIAYQIRVRNVGGIIVLDFIDMLLPENREKVQKALVEALKADKARTNVLKMSEIGLIEMTRKRVRESLVQRLTEPCFYCDGAGYLKAAALVAEEVLARIRKVIAAGGFRIVHVNAHQRVAEQLWEERRDTVVELEKRSGRTINIRAHDDFHLEQFEVFGK